MEIRHHWQISAFTPPQLSRQDPPISWTSDEVYPQVQGVNVNDWGRGRQNMTTEERLWLTMGIEMVIKRRHDLLGAIEHEYLEQLDGRNISGG